MFVSHAPFPCDDANATGRDPETMISDLKELKQTGKEISDAQHKRGERAMFKGARPDGQNKKFKHDISTEDEFDQICKCCSKGCCTDPLPPDGMYLAYGQGPQTKIPWRIKCSESTKNETLHKAINEVCMLQH